MKDALMNISFERAVRITLTAAALMVMTASVLIVQSVITLSQAADDILVLDHADDTVLSGTITELNAESMTLLVGKEEIDVDLDQVDRDVNIKDLLSEGQSVTVQGRFDNKEMKAKRVIANMGSDASAEIKAGIIAGDMDDKRRR